MPRRKANTVKIGKKVFKVKTAEELDTYDWYLFNKGITELQTQTNLLSNVAETVDLLKMLIPDLKIEDFKGVPPVELWNLARSAMNVVTSKVVEEEEEEVEGKKDPSLSKE